MGKTESARLGNNSSIKPSMVKKSSNEDSIKPVKLVRTAQRSVKTVEQYDCDDDFECELEDHNYFENQL